MYILVFCSILFSVIDVYRHGQVQLVYIVCVYAACT